MSLYAEKIAGLPLVVEGYSLELLAHDITSGFERLTNEIVLSGGGHSGRGEDVTYEAADQRAFHDAPRDLPLAFSGGFGEFSVLLGELDLFPQPPDTEVFRNYRRWGFEAAALDLALRQNGLSFDTLVGRPYRPVRFVVSMRLGDPPSGDLVKRWLAVDPGMQFKLDAQSSWSTELITELAATGAVESIDLKGHYAGTIVDQPPDPRLYRDVVELFPDAWIEDPAIVDATRAIIEPAIGRVTWDAPIHSVAEIEALATRPRSLNIKPSRFGTLSELIATIEHCDAHDIAMYSGGQAELGVGREQLHALASLFYPDSPNDAAPSDFNYDGPRPGLPRSPLPPPSSPIGFRWRPDGA